MRHQCFINASSRKVHHCTLHVADYKFSLTGLDEDKYEQTLKECHSRSAFKLQRLCFANGGIYIKLGQHVAQLVLNLPNGTHLVLPVSAPDLHSLNVYMDIMFMHIHMRMLTHAFWSQTMQLAMACIQQYCFSVVCAVTHGNVVWSTAWDNFHFIIITLLAFSLCLYCFTFSTAQHARRLSNPR